jgi:hypothetical protein
MLMRIACSLVETAGKLSRSVTPPWEGRYERPGRPAEEACRRLPADAASRMTDPK